MSWYKLSALTLGCLLVLAITPARAEVVYTYTGNPFTIVSAPYTTGDFVTGDFSLATPLAPNLPLTNVTGIDSFSLSDGVQTINFSMSPSLLNIQVATNASGMITSWNLLLGYSTTQYVSTRNDSTVVADAGSLSATKQADNDTSPGMWKSSVSTTPEPASLALFAAGVLALATLGIRKRAA